MNQRQNDNRFYLAAVNFLSNISLDGSYEDTKYATLLSKQILESRQDREDDINEEPEPKTPYLSPSASRNDISPTPLVITTSPTTTTTKSSKLKKSFFRGSKKFKFKQPKLRLSFGGETVLCPPTSSRLASQKLNLDNSFSIPNEASSGVNSSPNDKIYTSTCSSPVAMEENEFTNNQLINRKVLVVGGRESSRFSILGVLSILPFKRSDEISSNFRNRIISSNIICLKDAFIKFGVTLEMHEDETSLIQFLKTSGSIRISSIPQGSPLLNSRPPPPTASTTIGVTPSASTPSTGTTIIAAAPQAHNLILRASSASTATTTTSNSHPNMSPTRTSRHQILADIQALRSHSTIDQVDCHTPPCSDQPNSLVHTRQSLAQQNVSSQTSNIWTLLDDKDIMCGRHITVLKLPNYCTSIIEYVKPVDLKRDLNQQFHERFPKIQISLTKLRSLKTDMVIQAKKLNIDIWVVGHASVLFERMTLKGLVNKINRKLTCSACFLLSAKLNDIKGTDLNALLQELESYLRITRKELLLFELAGFVALEFSLSATDNEVTAHITRLL